MAKIRNYTFKNNESRIICKVMLDNNSDINKAREILLEVANSDSNVINEENSKSIVIVNIEFIHGYQSIVLSMWCYIKDVNIGYLVRSELEDKVLKKFERQGIKLKI